MTDATISHGTDAVKAARLQLPQAFDKPLSKRILPAAVVLVLIAPVIYSGIIFGVTPARILEGLSRFGNILAFMFPPYVWTSWEEWREILEGLGETVVMAFLGTLLGAVAAVPLAFLGAKNIMPFNWLRLLSRRGFDALRAVEQIILALIFIRAFGLGPLAGIMAIAVSEIGTFAKLFAEAVENTSRRPVDGVKASGGEPFPGDPLCHHSAVAAGDLLDHPLQLRIQCPFRHDPRHCRRRRHRLPAG